MTREERLAELVAELEAAHPDYTLEFDPEAVDRWALVTKDNDSEWPHGYVAVETYDTAEDAAAAAARADDAIEEILFVLDLDMGLRFVPEYEVKVTWKAAA